MNRARQIVPHDSFQLFSRPVGNNRHRCIFSSATFTAMTNVPRKIRDISPPVDEHAAVYPGDTAYSQSLHFALSPDCPVNVNSITLSPHTGAHADAPMHYANGGAASGELELNAYLGPCRVIHCMGCVPQLLSEHIARALADLPPRVLLQIVRVASQSWASFTAMAPQTLMYLADKNGALVGIDTPGLDPLIRPAWPPAVTGKRHVGARMPGAGRCIRRRLRADCTARETDALERITRSRNTARTSPSPPLSFLRGEGVKPKTT